MRVLYANIFMIERMNIMKIWKNCTYSKVLVVLIVVSCRCVVRRLQHHLEICIQRNKNHTTE